MATTKKPAEDLATQRQAPPAAAPPRRRTAAAKTKTTPTAVKPAAAADGFDAATVNASWEEAEGAVENAKDRAGALIDAWVKAQNAAAVSAIAESDSVPSSARKAARRALNVLKSRGVAIPERPRIARIGSEPSKIEAFYWAPDAAGTAMVTIVSQQTGGRCRRVDVLVNDRSGITQVLGGEPSRGQLREAFQKGEKQMGYGPASISIEWARAQIAQGRERTASAGAILPMGFDRFSDLIGEAPKDIQPHPLDAMELPEVSEEELTAASGTLHAEPEFRAWVPSGEAIQEMMIKLGEAISDVPGENDEKDQGKIEEAISAEVAAATDRYFTPELREVIANRMKDCAISVHRRAGAKRAAEVLAVAEAIRNAGLVTSPPQEIVFLRSMFSKALAVLAARSGGQLQVPLRPQAAG